MPVQAIDQLVKDVATETEIVAESMKNGATAEELAPLTKLSSDIQANSKALGDAIIANTPAATPPPAAPQP